MTDKILQNWLYQQCQILPGSRRAVLLTGPPDEGPYSRAFFWPDGQSNIPTLKRLVDAVLRSKQSVIKTRNNTTETTGEPLDAMACPVFLQEKLIGIVAIEMTTRSKPMQQAAIQQVQIGIKWLETMIQMNSSTSKEQLVTLIDLLAAGLEHENFQVALSHVATELAERFSCQRVSIGFLRYNRMRVEALSHSNQIDRQSNLVSAIRKTMTESADQGTSVVYPAENDDAIQVTHFHEQLVKQQEGVTICTVPLIKDATVIGALLLERRMETPFTREIIEQCEQIGLLLGPVLETRRRDERFIGFKILDSFRAGFGKLFGPKHLTLKVATGLSVIVVLWLSLANGQFRISTDSVLESSVCRVVVAPQEGYIAAAHARAGDLVKEGDLLATLDDKELRQERRKWLSQRDQLVKEYRKALASSDRAEVAILNAKRLQAEAQLNLVEQQLDRTSLLAPFSGLVVKGDLSQSLGSPVERGEVLYEVAPTDEYKVVLKVDDRDIGLITVGQAGKLRLSGIPDQLIEVQIDRVTPVSSVEEGRNYFRVEALMASPSDLLRPGMEGVTRIEIGEEKILWIWTRRMVEWLRIFTWSWLP
ncbi:MAG: HlyD family efflux transporter periplasmic adaptor subunit [Desulfuromusa sp.]|nr:HlyD family efflux transporter periplasmic adaptor subunit [Desulfuromusa sp.]